jgi:hypothetical protein
MQQWSTSKSANNTAGHCGPRIAFGFVCRSALRASYLDCLDFKAWEMLKEWHLEILRENFLPDALVISSLAWPLQRCWALAHITSGCHDWWYLSSLRLLYSQFRSLSPDRNAGRNETQREVTNACRFLDVLNDAGNCLLVLSPALSGIEFEIKRKLDKAGA